MSMVLMQLGEHKFFVPVPGFDTPSFDTFQRDTQFSWVPQARLSREPAMQFTGPGEDTLVIEGRLFPQIFGGTSTLEALRKSGKAGTPMTLIRMLPMDTSYYGQVVGDKWVIRRVRSNETRIGMAGVAHKIDFTLELAAFGSDAKWSGEFLFAVPSNAYDSTTVPQNEQPKTSGAN